MNNKRYLVFLILILLIGIVFALDTSINDETKITTNTFDGLEDVIEINGNEFKDIRPTDDSTLAYIDVDENGDIKKADLTANKDTSFVFDNKKIDIKEGMRVFYENGKISIKGDTEQEISVEDGETLSNIKLIDGSLEIEGNKLRGRVFEVGNLRVIGRNGNYGEVVLLDEGYLLSKGSVGQWWGMDILSQKNLLLSTSMDESILDNYENWILPDTQKLRAKGEDFEIHFNEGNHWAKIDSFDNFQIKAVKNFEMSLENRDEFINGELNGLIPKLEVQGEFAINQNYKSIYTQDGKIMVKRDGTIFGKGGGRLQTTSPIELLIKNGNEFNQEKYIVSNFKGIATVPLKATQGISEQRYSDSIYKIRAKTDNRYNYPTIKDFESISGKKIEFVGERINQPEYVRALIDIYESNPKTSFEGVNKIHIIEPMQYERKEIENLMYNTGGFYKSGEKEFYIKGKDTLTNHVYDTIIHEAAHGIHYDMVYLSEDYKKLKDIKSDIVIAEEVLKFTYDIEEIGDEIDFEEIPKMTRENYPVKIKELESLYQTKNELEGKIVPIDNEWKSTLEIDYDEIDFVERDNPLGGRESLVMYWESEKVDETFNHLISKELIEDGNELRHPYAGFVRPYGASNIKEDIATYREHIIGDPGYFKRYGLLEEAPGNIMYDPSYKQKIDLLYKYNFITREEYDAVLNPEKYGLL